MKRVAEKIGSAFDFVRVDLYEVDERIYFGETTFYPASGYARYHPVPSMPRWARCGSRPRKCIS